MKSIRITFRLTPYQLARGLETIRALEPAYKLTSVNELVKTIYHDYNAKMSINRGNDVSQELVDEIMMFQNLRDNKPLTIDDLIDIKSAPLTNELPEQQPPDIQNKTNEVLNNFKQSKPKASEFDDPNKTDSSISSLTDFSPPKDWTE